MLSTDVNQDQTIERLAQTVTDLVAEQIQTRLAVAQLAAIITGQRVRVPLPVRQ